MIICNNPDKNFNKCVVCMTIRESLGGIIDCEIAGRVGYLEKNVLEGCKFAEKTESKI